MKPIQGHGLLSGMRHAMRGFVLITRPGIRQYVVIPLLINLVLFAGALTGVGAAVDYALAQFASGWPEWIQWLLWVLAVILSLVVVFFTFSLVANLVASPFNGMLSEAVERYLDPALEPEPFSMQRLLADLPRMLLSELRKLFYIALRALPLLLLTIIPLLNVSAPLLWLVFGAWMLCLEYLDCPLGNHHALFPRVIEEMRAQRRLAMGFGLCMSALTLIPVVNFIAMPVGVAGATSLYRDAVATRTQ